MTDGLGFPDPPISFADFRLRPWATRDVPALVAAWRDPAMHRWMPEEADPFETEQAVAFVEDASKHLIDGKTIALAIADPVSDQAVGSLTLHVWGQRHWSVGYWMAVSHRNRGLATAALKALCRWAFFAYPALARVSLYTLPGNEPSQKVAQRAGFKPEGVLRRWAEVGPQQLDWAMYSLIREDLDEDEG